MVEGKISKSLKSKTGKYFVYIFKIKNNWSEDELIKKILN